MTFDQIQFETRFEWGENGVTILAPSSDVVIIVDVLSFTSCVEVATGRGAAVFPYRWKDFTSVDFAAEVGASLAGSRREGGLSLSPVSMLSLENGDRIVLPSPNGSSLSLMTGVAVTLAGCLRNAAAVARYASETSGTVAVIAAGERWPDGSLRPALEDYLGAGAIIDHLRGRPSPEAEAARDAYRARLPHLQRCLLTCGSGRELIEHGYREDVLMAAELNVSECVPQLIDEAFVSIRG
jgi:2-phosphosulfolactate phosphatase